MTTASTVFVSIAFRTERDAPWHYAHQELLCGHPIRNLEDIDELALYIARRDSLFNVVILHWRRFEDFKP